MGKAFFNDWQLWEKLTFILAFSLTLTILIGFIKLWHNHARIKKYAKAPPKEVNLSREKSIIRSVSHRKSKRPMTEKKTPRVIDDGVEIPFGIRAIESGIEVDGVWISRNNSPQLLPNFRRQSSAASLLQLSNPSSVDLEKGQGQGQETSFLTGSTPLTSRRSSYMNGRSYSQDSIASNTTSENGQNVSSIRYPPHSYMRYENTRHFRRSRAMNSSESLPRSGSTYDHTRSSSNNSSDSGSSSRNNSTSSDETSSSYQDIPTPRPQLRQVNHDTLEMLQAHRLSHAAETGQLIPRNRRPGHSGEWASIANFAPIVSGEIVNFSMPRNSIVDVPLKTPPGSASSHKSNPFTTPTSSKASEDSWGLRKMSADSTPDTSPRTHRASSSFSITRPESVVLREVNSGFSVLRPGTLDAQLQAQRERSRSNSPHQRQLSSSMSVSRHGSQKQHSRWLQKGRRPSEDSERTSISLTSSTEPPTPRAASGTSTWGSDPYEIERRPSPATVLRSLEDLNLILPPPPPPLAFEEGAANGPASVHDMTKAMVNRLPISYDTAGGPIDESPSSYEIARGAAVERDSIVKYSFDGGQRPPSALEMARGAELEERAKYKF